MARWTVPSRRAALGASAVIGATWWYRRWLRAQARRASAGSRIVGTRLGPVEYDLRGTGPTVLQAHGGGVGHAGWFMLGHHRYMNKAGGPQGWEVEAIPPTDEGERYTGRRELFGYSFDLVDGAELIVEVANALGPDLRPEPDEDIALRESSAALVGQRPA